MGMNISESPGQSTSSALDFYGVGFLVVGLVEVGFLVVGLVDDDGSEEAFPDLPLRPLPSAPSVTPAGFFVALDPW